jgi:multisubunit Na+/H+ antiporter MnhE subunit
LEKTTERADKKWRTSEKRKEDDNIQRLIVSKRNIMDIRKNYMNIRVMAFLMLTITLGTLIASNLGILTTWQSLAINVASLIITATFVIYLLYRLRKLTRSGVVPSNFRDVKVIIPKANVNNRLVLANSDVFKQNIVPTNPLRRSIFRLSMEINSSIEQLGISAIRLRDRRITENTIKKNLTAKELCVIDTVVSPNETINFKFDKDIDINKMLIDELYVP